MNKYFLKSNEKLLGKTVKVLVDGVNPTNKTALYGYTESNKLVNFDGNIDCIGKIVSVKITDSKTWSLDGTIVDE